MSTLDTLDSGRAVEALARWLFAGPFASEGVVHPTACVARPDGYRALRIEEGTPQSGHDTFALHLQRARADAIVSTGAILRAEPDVDYALQASPFGTGLAAYRAALGKPNPPRVVILSRKGDLPLGHRALACESVELWSPSPLPGVRHRPFMGEPLDAIEALRNEVGLVVVEAGPSVTRGLHAADVIDALYLTTFEGDVAEEHLAGASFDDEGLRSRLPVADPSRRVEEPSGPWRFRRHRR